MNRPRKPGSNLPPCVHFKHGAFYYIKRGKWERIGTTLGEALAEYARRLEAPKGGMVQLINDAMPSVKAGNAESTKKQYDQAAEILRRKLVQFSPEQVQGKHIAAIRRSMANTPNMANRVLSVARLIFHYAVEEQIVGANPCIGVKRLDEAKRTRLISDDEWRRIYAKAGPRLKVIMDLQFHTGQRINDVLKIRRSQLTDAGIEFVQQKTKNKVTIRWSAGLKAAVAAANSLYAGKPTALTLLRGNRGKAPDYKTVQKQWNEAAAAAGVEDARLNDARAMAATAVLRQGGDPQKLLGHSTATTTKRYLRDKGGVEVDGPKLDKTG